MAQEALKVLLIEDSTSDIIIIKQTMAQVESPKFDITAVQKLGEGLDLLKKNSFDAIILDLELPDSPSDETLKRVLSNVKVTPVVVLTRSMDETFSIQALRLGAQDFVPKSDLRSRLLARSVSYAIERAAQLNSFKEELRWLEAMYSFCVDPSQEDVVPMAGFASIEDRELNSLERQYRDLILHAAKVDEAGASIANQQDAYYELACELGKREASPKDLANMHGDVLQQLADSGSPEHTSGLVEAGREVLLNLMGYLADYYRRNPTPK